MSRLSSPLFMYRFDLDSQELAGAYLGTGAAKCDYNVGAQSL